MDQAQRLLYGEFPRSVASSQDNGQLRQFMVHSEGEFDLFTKAVNRKRNAYASLSWFPVGGNTKCDKVSYDFDSPFKNSAFAEGNETSDVEKVRLMRDDDQIAHQVLGGVVEDVRELARASQEDGIPVVGVFSGLGMHVHQLFQPEESPKKEMGSTCRRYIDTLDLDTADEVPVGDEMRIMRVPNMKRVQMLDDDDKLSREASVFCIPLSGDELCEITVDELLELSLSPRPDIQMDVGERPQMALYEDYERSRVGKDAMQEVSEPTSVSDENVEWLLDELVPLPCIRERVKTRHPGHDVRVYLAIHLFNVGMSVGEAVEFISKLGWEDFDRETTTRNLKSIWRTGYSDPGCKTLRENGLCTRADDPVSCEAYGWSNGQCEWK